jgi:hypothetical protein
VRCLSLVLLAFLVVAFLVSVPPAKASLLVVDKHGEIIWKVLSSEDSLSLGIPQHEFLEVTKIAAESGTPEKTKISLKKEGEKISLNVGENGEGKDVDVSHWQDDLIEIEERGETQKVRIAVKDGKLRIIQNGFTAVTDFSINIDPETNEFSVLTPSGADFLSVLPFGAAESVLRAKVISKFSDDPEAELVESEGRELVYAMNGEKVINILNLLEYSIPVKTQVSALTGEIVLIEQPVWLNIFGFLFT